jgi:predicted transcriptional regulator
LLINEIQKEEITMSEQTSYSVQLSKELRKEIRQISAKHDMSMAAWIRKAIEKELKRERQGNEHR